MRRAQWFRLIMLGVLWGGLQAACFGQNRINNLIFNSTEQIIGLEFTSIDNPKVFYTGKRADATIGEGIAHAENEQGEIVFWVNSSGVYDQNNSLMPGSAGILAHPSSTEIVISPFPDNPSRYYIFYNNQLCSTLYYSVVDMSLRSGKGDVSQLNKALSPEKNFAEGLEIIRIPCTKNYWLLANECGKGLTRFQVTEEGLSEGVLFLNNPHNEGGRGELDYHKGKLGYAITFHKSCLIADFDPITGAATNARFIPLPLQNGAYGLEFSPDATKLYVTDLSNRDIFGNPSGNNLYALDLATGASKSWRIGNTNTACSSQMEGLGHIELGKDGRLYISQIGGCQIVVVEDADTDAPLLKRINVSTVLSAGISDHIQSDFLDQDLLQEASIAIHGSPSLCTTVPVMLAAVVASPADKQYQWYHNGVAIEKATSATYAAFEKGVYALYISNAYGCSLKTMAVVVEDDRIPEISYQKLYEACGTEAVTLSFPGEGYRIRWSNGTEVNTTQVTESGEYQLTVSKGNCSRTETVQVLIRPKVHYKIPNVITANGDSKNDFFEIRELQEVVQLYIYNRWGTLVYFSPDYQNDWQGHGLPMGTYYYRIIPNQGCGQEQKGWLQLMGGKIP